MSLKETLFTDMKQAMKNKDKELLTTIRLINASIKNEEIKLRKELSDEDVLRMISRELKQTNESLEAYSDVGNQEKIKELTNRINALKSYMPEQLDEDEIRNLVSSLIANNNFEGKKDKGKLMKVLMPEVKGKADGRLVNQIVEEFLN